MSVAEAVSIEGYGVIENQGKRLIIDVSCRLSELLTNSSTAPVVSRPVYVHQQGGSVSGLTPSQILFGAEDGTIGQNKNFRTQAGIGDYGVAVFFDEEISDGWHCWKAVPAPVYCEYRPAFYTENRASTVNEHTLLRGAMSPSPDTGALAYEYELHASYGGGYGGLILRDKYNFGYADFEPDLRFMSIAQFSRTQPSSLHTPGFYIGVSGATYGTPGYLYFSATPNGTDIASGGTYNIGGVPHAHDDLYSFLDHNHDGVYSQLGHNHDEWYAPLSHTHTFAAIVSKPTTISGYGITDAASGTIGAGQIAVGVGGNVYGGYAGFEYSGGVLTVPSFAASSSTGMRQGTKNLIRNFGTTYPGVAVGPDTCTYDPLYGVGLGPFAMQNTTAEGCMGIGYGSLQYCTTGGNNVGVGVFTLNALVNGTGNFAAGGLSLQALVAGDRNFGLGYASFATKTSGSDNIGIGVQTGYFNAAGSRNLFIGTNSGVFNTGSDNVFLGFNSGYNETGSNLLYIANTNTAAPLIWGDFANSLLRFNAKVGIGRTPITYSLEVATNLAAIGTAGATIYSTAGATANSATFSASNSVGNGLALRKFGSAQHASNLLGLDSVTFSNGALFTDGGKLAIGTTDAYSLLLSTNGVSAMTIDSSQRVGIGVAPSYDLHIEKSKVGGTICLLRNTLAGVGNYTNLSFGNDIGNGAGLDHYSSTYTTVGASIANSFHMYNTRDGGIRINAKNAAGGIFFYTGASETLAMSINPSQCVGISVSPVSTSWLSLPSSSALISSLNIGAFNVTVINPVDGDFFKAAVDSLAVKMATNTRTLAFLEKAQTFSALQTINVSGAAFTLSGALGYITGKGYRPGTVLKTAAYTITTGDEVISCTTSTAAYNITLPTPVAGMRFTVSKSEASTTYGVAVVTGIPASHYINGGLGVSYLLSTAWSSVTFVAVDSTHWVIVNKIP